MDAIDLFFSSLAEFTQTNLPSGIFTDLVSQGIIPGIGGVVIFIPQIALLFFFISILEETGYLSRVVFIMDRMTDGDVKVKVHVLRGYSTKVDLLNFALAVLKWQHF